MNYHVHAMDWAEIELLLDQVSEMQTDNTYTYHYPQKKPDLIYVRGKILELEAHLKKGNTLFAGAVKKGKVLGYIWCYTGIFIDKKRLHINALYVNQDIRGNGLAHELMSYAEDWARQQDCTELATHYAIWNEQAGRFYGAVGFKPARVEVVKTLT